MSTTPKLPETPYNGVVVSVTNGNASSYKIKHIAIADADSTDGNGPLIYIAVYTGITPDPRVHLKKGHKVKVTKVWQHADTKALTGDVEVLNSLIAPTTSK